MMHKFMEGRFLLLEHGDDLETGFTCQSFETPEDLILHTIQEELGGLSLKAMLPMAMQIRAVLNELEEEAREYTEATEEAA